MRGFTNILEMEKEMPVFWGCTITHNYPYIMESTKKALKTIGIEATDVLGFGCCPDPVYAKACGEEMALSLSARNLALAEKAGDTLLVACNGCYSVLSDAARKLTAPKIREKTNSELPEELRYDGTLKVVHLLEMLHKKLPLIRSQTKKPLKGLKVAAHYGCHILYPPAVASDDPERPRSMEDIIEALGAESVEYPSRLGCCGTPAAVFDKEEADALLKKKLEDLKDKADCIVTACPACFMRFDLLPQEYKEMSTPVFHISELLCLGFGTPIEQLFLDLHSVKVASALEKIGAVEDGMKLVKEKLDYAELCGHCGACRDECLAAKTEDRFNPIEIVDELLAGKYSEVLADERIWMCLQCGRCEERCPQNTGLKTLFARLRELSMEEKGQTKVVRDKIAMIAETGYGMPARQGVRKRMGLADAPKMDATEVRRILEKHRGIKDAKDVH
jgi:heterodisulfide reductase subunit B2